MRLHSLLPAAILLAAVTNADAQTPVASPPALLPSGAVTTTVPLDRVIAIVGDVIITQSNLQERVIQKRQEGARIPDDSTAFRTFISGVLTELVDEELLLGKAKELKVEVPDADVTATVDKQFKEIRKRFGSESEFKSELAKAGYGAPDEYRRFLVDGIKRNETITRTIRKLREDGKIAQANVTDAEVTEAYERNKATLPKREPSVAWRQIIVAPKPTPAASDLARQKAESLLVELKSGGDFEKLAKRESADAGSKDNGGDLGWNRRGRMVPAFDRWMFALPPGQLSPVVPTVYGFHIIRVDRANPAEVKARHILIAARIDSLDVARARIEADSVKALLQSGAPFDSVAKKHHDFGSGEETTLLSPIPRATMPAPYQEAFLGKKAGDYAVFQIPGNANVPAKFVVAHIASVEEGGDLTLIEVKERFRARLAEEGGIKRLMDTLRKGTYVSVRADALSLPPLPTAAP